MLEAYKTHRGEAS